MCASGSTGRLYNGALEPVIQRGPFGLRRGHWRVCSQGVRVAAVIPFRRVCCLRPKAGLANTPTNNFNPDLIMARPDTSKSIPRACEIRPANQMPLVHPHAAGIDLGNQSHFVCVPADSVPPGESPVREFGVFNPDLDQMVDRFKQCRVETVAMESTGVMWIPVFQKLEAAGLEVLLVNTKGLKHVPGRKSDMLDCQWIQLTHSYGLLAGSFRPADIICRVRDADAATGESGSQREPGDATHAEGDAGDGGSFTRGGGRRDWRYRAADHRCDCAGRLAGRAALCFGAKPAGLRVLPGAVGQSG